MADRLSGLVLFLPIPVVLFLLTRAPLGIAWSLLVGVALVVTHRLYARPFALARASRRCLWCGGAARDGPALVIEEPIATTRWRACSEGHAERTRRFLGWAFRLVGVVWLALALAHFAGRLPALPSAS